MPPKKVKTSTVDDEKSIIISETNEEIDPAVCELTFKIQSDQSPTLSELHRFFNDPTHINPVKDPSTNIIDRFTGKCYKIPDRKIQQMFKLMDACRRKKERIMYTEKQLEHSGIMIDLDVYQDKEENQITTEHIKSFCNRIIILLIKMLKFPEKKNTIILGVTRKPKITYKEEKQAWKDGLHILIPGIKVTRGFKRLLLNKLIQQETLDQVFDDVMPADIKDRGQQYQRNDFLDTNSAHVPVHFVGCPTKKGSVPYALTHIIEYRVDAENALILNNESRNSWITDEDFNPMYEFSINYEMPTGKIKKLCYTVNDQYISDLSEVEQKSKPKDDELIRNYGELSTNAIHDVTMREVKDLLDILNPTRYEKYEPWFQVLCVLANTSISYKSLAEYFSRKSKKFNMSDFETCWAGLTRNRVKRSALQLGSLHYWAKQDNKEKYDLVRKDHIGTLLWNMVTEQYREGHLSHADIATILHTILKHKYVTDIPEGDNKRVWYEFVLDDDDYIDGEIYKWRQHVGAPKSLSIYISNTLPNLFDKVLKMLKTNQEQATGGLHKYLGLLISNMKKTIRSLGNHAFKQQCMKEAEDLFHQYGFYDSLDKDPLIRGVQNGILKLSITPGGRPRLIQGYHLHRVSKYTKVPYIPFNPYDPLTKRIIIALRNLFPDDEPDSFEFTMYYFASTIDGNPKESMFMIVRGGGGNGKTFIVELHKATIGNIYGVKMPLCYLTSKTMNADGATPAQMQLKDASLATYSESNRMEVLNAARIKEVTGLETLAGRKLHKDMVNFKPKCHHLVTTNYDFVVECNDHGTWRRIVYNPLKITFVAKHEYDGDYYKRIRDDTVTDVWTEDSEVRGRYLGYMVWMHYWLYQTYGGKLANVPKPHIIAETERYRCRQDTMTSFLAQRCVKTADPKAESLLVDEAQKYIRWYLLNQGSPITAKVVIDHLLNSRITKHIISTHSGQSLVGMRFLEHGQQPDVGEEYAFKDILDTNDVKDNYGIKPETAEEYHARLCREYDVNKYIFNSSETFDAVADVDGNEYVMVDAPPKQVFVNSLTKEKLNHHNTVNTNEINIGDITESLVVEHDDHDDHTDNDNNGRKDNIAVVKDIAGESDKVMMPRKEARKNVFSDSYIDIDALPHIDDIKSYD